MTQRNTRKILITCLTLFAIGAFGIFAYRALYYYPSDEVVLSPEVEAELTKPREESTGTEPDVAADGDQTPTIVTEEPETEGMKIVIPKIKVDADVTEVGLTTKGNMAAPRNFFDVGWYKYGTFPGETGSAVLAGHVDNGIALPAVFKKLGDLETGDDIYITTEDGKELHFVVTGEKTYAYDESPKEVFEDNSGKYIKLITCTGSVIKELRTHSQRLVVTAKLVEA